MIGRRLTSFLKRSPPSQVSSSAEAVEEGNAKRWGRRVASAALICLTGGIALSALDDLAIFYGCSSKALEKANTNQTVLGAIGEPVVRGPWYSASLAVAHRRKSVSCTFPVSGPQGTGIFQLKAVRNDDDTRFSLFRPRSWEILIMEALLHVPANEEKNQTFRINLSDSFPPSACKTCTTCPPQESEVPEKK
ncbi:hypothetical protein RJ640_029150 [Escallonia rubra]|uniref:Uncharacterized protein n=1 Tax=Escallonia rubra TaxID=112253 RepID=A0AA88R6Q1_9ASTE|nr:hypothetical protein RJ640_029150 [Escallonia rubra]